MGVCWVHEQGIYLLFLRCETLRKRGWGYRYDITSGHAEMWPIEITGWHAHILFRPRSSDWFINIHAISTCFHAHKRCRKMHALRTSQYPLKKDIYISCVYMKTYSCNHQITLMQHIKHIPKCTCTGCQIICRWFCARRFSNKSFNIVEEINMTAENV